VVPPNPVRPQPWTLPDAISLSRMTEVSPCEKVAKRGSRDSAKRTHLDFLYGKAGVAWRAVHHGKADTVNAVRSRDPSDEAVAMRGGRDGKEDREGAEDTVHVGLYMTMKDEGIEMRGAVCEQR
jgi:hypothetical protein